MRFEVLIEFQVLIAAAPVLCCFRSSASTCAKKKIVPLALSPIDKHREEYLQSLKRWGQPKTSLTGSRALGRTRRPNCTVCGYRGVVRDINEIIGGVPTPINLYPWQAFVRSQNYHCGGVLIAPQWVLTAAHCISTVTYVLLGTSDLLNHTAGTVNRESSKVIVHERYRTVYDDVALIKLDSPVKYTGNIRPICLPTGKEDFRMSQVCYLTGWGYTDAIKGKPSTSLQEIKVRIMSHSECFTRWLLSGRVITLGHLCTEMDWAQPNSGACFGDSGGPLACQVGDIFYLAGLASRVQSNCQKTAIPDLFVRVSNYRNWIANNILKKS